MNKETLSELLIGADRVIKHLIQELEDAEDYNRQKQDQMDELNDVVNNYAVQIDRLAEGVEKLKEQLAESKKSSNMWYEKFRDAELRLDNQGNTIQKQRQQIEAHDEELGKAYETIDAQKESINKLSFSLEQLYNKSGELREKLATIGKIANG